MLRRWAFCVFAMILAGCNSADSDRPIGLPQLPEDPNGEIPEAPQLSDQELLDLTQRETFRYFWEFAEANSGAARERVHPGDPSNDPFTVTTGGSGFGLMALLTGIQRGLVSRADARARIDRILTFFENADRFHGAWPHWLDGRDGRVRPFSPMDNGGDLVETAFLAQGLVCVYEFFREGSAEEQSLATRADALWKGVEWDWYTQGQEVLFWHWSPDFGFAINLPLRGYNETHIAYVMAAASPDHAITRDVYENGWAGGGAITSAAAAYGYPLEVSHAGNPSMGGPLFWAHYSYLGLDPRQLSDRFADYGIATKNHALINYRYCVDNPKNFVDYGSDCWGLTASYSRNADASIGYSAHSPSNDIGVISPTAALSSFPYTPDESIRVLRYFYSHRNQLLGPAGFYDAFSPHFGFWVADAYLAIDQGPIIIMIENYRSGMFWELFMRNEDVRSGLDLIGLIHGN